MKTLFLDLESLPADPSDSASMDSLRRLYERKLYKKSQQEGDPDVLSFEDYLSGTSFDGGFGRVLCIALAVNGDAVKCYCNDKDNKLNEKKTLEQFWEVARQCDLFVGHNIFDFDMRFIYQRSIVLGVKPTKDLSFARYRSSPMFDTMQEWSKWGWSGNKVGLEYLALALGIPSPKEEGIDGSQVAEFYKKGEIDMICEYCKRDVETTRKVYNKMVFNSND